MSAAQIRVVWFVHRPDTACLLESLRQAERAFPAGTTFHVFADAKTGGIEPGDAEWPYAAYNETAWDRGGNLNGLPAVDGILRCMRRVARSKDDVVWKLDADTLVGDPGVLLDWFDDPNLTGAGLLCPWAAGWWGISYALRASVIEPLRRLIMHAGEAGLAQIGLREAHEDMVISRTMAAYESSWRLRSWMTRREGGAFRAHSYERGEDPRQALSKWGIVTFGNRWQIEGDDAQKRAMVAKTMALAGAAWAPERRGAWRNATTEALWQVGVPAQFGKSALKCQ